MKLNVKIIAIFILSMIIAVSVVFFYLVPKIEKTTLGIIEENYIESLNHVDDYFDDLLVSVAEDFDILLENKDITDADSEVFFKYYDIVENYREYNPGPEEKRVYQVFKTYYESKDQIIQLFAGRENGSFVSAPFQMDIEGKREDLFNYDPRVRPWYHLAMENADETVMTVAYEAYATVDDSIGAGSIRYTSAISRTIRNQQGEIVGVLCVDIEMNSIKRYLIGQTDGYGSIGVMQSDNILTTNEDGDLVLLKNSENQELVSTINDLDARKLSPTRIDGEEFYIIKLNSSINDWKIYYKVSKATIDAIVLETALPTALTVFGIMVFLIILIVVFLSVSISRPIKKLNKVTKQIASSGNLDIDIPIKSGDEIGDLSRSFTKMVGNIKDTNNNLENMVVERTKELTKFSKGIEQSPAVVVITDINGTIEYVNPKFTEITGYTKEEAIGQNPRVLKSGLTPDHVYKDMWTTVLNGSEWDGVFCNKNKGGELFWERVSMSPIKDDEGNIINILAVKEDITQQRIATEEVKQALNTVEKLYKSSIALRSTMDLSEVLDIILSGLKEVVPFDTATVLEMVEGFIRIIHCQGYAKPEDIIGAQFLVEKDTFNDEIVNGKTSVIINDVRKHDNFVDMSDDKKIRSFMGVPLVVNDVNIGILTIDSNELDSYDEQMAETVNAFASQAALALNSARNLEELRVAKDIAEAATKAKGDFLANMSHEIRTPMNAVIGLNSLLKRTELKPKQKDYVTKVGRSATNLLTIINDILDFSKIESGKLAIEAIDFNLEDVLDNLSAVLGLKAYERGIELVITKHNNVPVNLVGDPLRVGQILLNLANNAIKFTGEGEVIIKVEMMEQTDGEVHIKFSVKDSGIGMTEEQVSKLFQAFTQADVSTTRKYGGTGLGLSISKNLVGLMGGDIWADSVYGEGSVFSFTLGFTISKNVVEKKDIVPSFLKSLDILIVEDNETAREVLNNFLEKMVSSTTLAASGEEAVSEVKSGSKFDLVLMDMKMPGMNGIETWKQIKMHVEGREEPKCILVTAYGKEEVNERAKSEGIIDVVTKPIAASSLFDAIVGAFDSNARRTETGGSNWKYPDGFEKVRGAKILLVEDNEVNQQVASETIEIEGFWVEIADNGQIAVDMLEKSGEDGYDLVLMDLQMPVLDGYAASSKIRNELKMPEIPIIALSADAMSGTRDDAIAAGMVDYLSKPIDKSELFNILVKWIKPGERTQNKVDLDKDFDVSVGMMENILRNIDVADGTNRVAGNIDLYISILKKFVKHNVDFEDKLRKLMDDGEKEESKRLVHTVKGVAANIGARTLNFLVKSLEELIVKEDVEYAQLDKEIKTVNAELKIISEQVTQLVNEIDENSSDDNSGVIIDKYELVQRLTELQKYIEEYDTLAAKYYEELIDYMPAFDLKAKYLVMGDSLDEYDFDAALDVCTEIINKLQD